MKNTTKMNKKVTRSLADYRAMYYSFKGGRLVVNVLTAFAFIGIIAYKFYHWMFVSQSYAQDDETMWLLIPLFAIMGLWIALTIIQNILEDKYKAAIKRAKRRHEREQITIQDMMDIHENNLIDDIMRSSAIQKISDDLKERIESAPEFTMEELETNTQEEV